MAPREVWSWALLIAALLAAVAVAVLGMQDHSIDDLSGWTVVALLALTVLAPAAGLTWRARNPRHTPRH